MNDLATSFGMKTNTKRLSQSKSAVFQFNLLLIALAVMFLVLYIFSINKIAVLEYSLNSKKADLAKENLLTESLVEREQAGIDELLAMAKQRNMVEVKNYDTFFQEAGVALHNR